MDNNPQFDAAYWRSKPVEVRAFQSLPDEAARAKLAQDLLPHFTIDLQIMVWGWEPYKVMFMRQLNGTPWVQPLNQHIEYAFGPNTQGLPIYDPANPPAGSILVSADAKDYPPFPDQIPVAPAPISSSHVGSYLGSGVYASLEGDTAADGQQVVKDGQTFTMHRHYIWGGLEPRWYTKG